MSEDSLGRILYDFFVPLPVQDVVEVVSDRKVKSWCSIEDKDKKDADTHGK